jgi:hypothetical protein
MSFKHNFLISGFGRSGTKFLATVMNLSPSWVVKHEAIRELDNFDKIQESFQQDFYGDVNSPLRSHFLKIKVAKKGIILRDPKDIFLSVCNRGFKDHEILYEIEDLNFYWNIFHSWLKQDREIYEIRFEKMVTDLSYLQEICKNFGINDIDFKRVNLNKKINPNNPSLIKYESFEDLPTLWKNKWFQYNWIENN